MINALLAAGAGASSSVNKVSIPPIRYLPILPPIIMIGGAVVLLAVASLVKRDLRVRVSTIGSVIIAGGAFGISIWQWSDVQSHGAHTYIAHAVVMDGFSVLVTMLLSAAMLLTALVADGYLRREGIAGAEFHVLALVSVSGAMLMGSANDLIIVFLGLEILSIALYVLTAFNHHMATSGEAALKYFILGGFSSAIFIYGIALTYGATGSTNLTQIADYLSKNVVLTNGLLLAGLASDAGGLRLQGGGGAVPHVDPRRLRGRADSGHRIHGGGGQGRRLRRPPAGAVLLPRGHLGRLEADHLRAGRALARSSAPSSPSASATSSACWRTRRSTTPGSSCSACTPATPRGVSSSLYYLVAYTFMTIGTFAIVTVLGRTGDEDHDLTRYRGLAQRQPVLALSLAVLLLAQAGVPFTTGLWAKLQVVLATVSAGAVPLAVIAMVTAAIAAFFYLRVAVLMYVSSPSGRGRQRHRGFPAGPARCRRRADSLGQPRRRGGHRDDA